jgi:hypothetical protein
LECRRSLGGPLGRAFQDIVQRRERVALDGTGLIRVEVAQDREHALLDRLADRLPRQHSNHAFDRDVRFLCDLRKDRHSGTEYEKRQLSPRARVSAGTVQLCRFGNR